MWDTYNELAHIYFKNAIVAVDSFHVIKQLNDAMIKVRIKIMHKYNTKTNRLIDNDMYYYMLKKFHYFFVKNYEDIYSGYIKINKINAKWKKDEILKYLLSIDDDLKKAYILKEKYREFNSTASYDNCDDELESLINEFNNSTLDEFRAFGRLIRNWKKEIKNSLIRINGRRLSNGAMV
jgi:transposase